MSWRVSGILACLFLAAGCTAFPGGSAYDAGGSAYFFGAFEDIPIPKEMNNCKETTVLRPPDAPVSGRQVFTGRVEAESLTLVMQSYLERERWTLRASTRGGGAMLLFDKAERYAIIQIIDDLVFTDLLVYVLPRLEAVPAAPAAPPAGSGPAVSFDQQSLSE